jgi:glutamine synthetase
VSEAVPVEWDPDSLLAVGSEDHPASGGPRAVMLVFVDNAGVARMKCVPAERLERAATRGVGISVALGALTATDAVAAVPGFDTPVGDMRLVADLSSLRRLPRDPAWGWALVDQYDQAGHPWPGCQRGFLRRMVDRATDVGLELRCAFELEWWVGRRAPDGSVCPRHHAPGYGAALDQDNSDQLLDIVDDLRTCGVLVEQVHPEFGRGQFELSLPVARPLVACDQAVFARKVIRDAVGRHGMVASFSPLPLAGNPGNGAHAHFSLWHEERNLFFGGSGPHGLTDQGEWFLAGVREHLAAMTAIGSPCPLSYARLKPSSFAGAYACWGLENRETALRLEAVEGPSAASSANVEWKSVDMAANPYLVQGAILAAGLDGLRRRLRLAAPVTANPEALDERQRRAGAVERLPSTLDSAIATFSENALLREAMGDVLFGSVLATRRLEAEVAAELDERALIERYREVF